jgi:hypothetical protein
VSRFVLPLQAVSDGYTYFSCPNTQFVTVQVFNNGIDIGYGQGVSGRQGSAMYPPADEYLALQSATLPRSCDEIRFKNHVAGKAAQIQITTQGTDDLPGGNPLAVGISPNFLTINPDGTVGATFTGLINAQGLILPSYPETTLPAKGAYEIQWQRSSDGAQVAHIIAGDLPANQTNDLTISSDPVSGSTQQSVSVQAGSRPTQLFLEDGANGSFQTYLNMLGPPLGNSITMSINNQFRTLLDSGGGSDFYGGITPNPYFGAAVAPTNTLPNGAGEAYESANFTVKSPAGAYVCMMAGGSAYASAAGATVVWRLSLNGGADNYPYFLAKLFFNLAGVHSTGWGLAAVFLGPGTYNLAWALWCVGGTSVSFDTNDTQYFFAMEVP